MSMISKIGSSALVLEIGSGAKPWSRSDVLVDRFYLDDCGQRGGAEIYRDRRPLIVANGERLPFIDKAFDFVYCSHVIEHADDIGSFLSEMSRVGKGGYLECPNPALERVLDQPQHRWYISNVDGRLLIYPKTENSRITTGYDRFYFHMMSDHFILRHYWDLFVVKLEWRGRIEYEMCSSLAPILAEEVSEEEIEGIIREQRTKVLCQAWYDSVKEKFQYALRSQLNSSSMGPTALQLGRRLRRASRQVSGKVRVNQSELEQLLRCPYCKAKVSNFLSMYQCGECGSQYPIQNGVPYFL